MEKNELSCRNAPIDDLSYRKMAMAITEKGRPATLDDDSRSVEVVGATESPVPMMDWSRGEMVPEVLLMSGCDMPETKQMPLLNNHDRYSSLAVIGSYRDIRIEKDQLIGRAYFSAAPEVEGIYTRVKEGHLTDFSAGYRTLEALFIPAGQKQAINGRTFDGPMKVVIKWAPKEMSICPIGADANAKARAATAPDLINERQIKKEVNMDKKVREFLESRGLAKDATEEQAYAYLQKLDLRTEAPAAVSVPSPTVDEVKVRTEAARAEQTRCLEIRGLCTHAGVTDEKEIAPFITENKSVEEVRRAMFDRLVKKPAETPGFRPSIEVGADERDKFRAAAGDAILIRSGSAIEKPAAGAIELAGFSLKEIAREALRISGRSISGQPMEMVGRALTTSDLPNILLNVANKSLFEGYETAEETWQAWCATGSVSDFKKQTIVRASETQDLDEIKEDDEYKYDKQSDSKEEFKIATYGKIYKISRQVIINDDLGAIIDIPKAHGQAAARKVGDLPYAVLTANAAMGDGVALFHATHGNLGSAGVPSETTIAEMIKLMKLQKDIAGKRRLNIRAQFFIAPATLEGSAEVFFTSNQFTGGSGTADSSRTNPYAGNRFTRVYEPRLDDASTTAWYVAGSKGKTVKVFFLNGVQTPYMETREGWTVDGVECKVRIDAGAKAVDWKAMGKNAGA